MAAWTASRCGSLISTAFAWEDVESCRADLERVALDDQDPGSPIEILQHPDDLDVRRKVAADRSAARVDHRRHQFRRDSEAARPQTVVVSLAHDRSSPWIFFMIRSRSSD